MLMMLFENTLFYIVQVLSCSWCSIISFVFYFINHCLFVVVVCPFSLDHSIVCSSSYYGFS